MPSLTEIRQQRKALKDKYGELPTVNIVPGLTMPVVSYEEPQAPAARPVADSAAASSVRLTDAQVAALVAAGIKDGTDWRHQLDQALGLYLDLREEMPEEEWGDKDLPADMRSELLDG